MAHNNLSEHPRIGVGALLKVVGLDVDGVVAPTFGCFVGLQALGGYIDSVARKGVGKYVLSGCRGSGGFAIYLFELCAI